MLLMFYGKDSETAEDPSTQIEPVPKINITQNPVFANDVVIGYTWTIDFNGFCAKPEETPNGSIVGIRHVLHNIEVLRAIFSQNGSNLFIRDNDNNELILAKGGILRGLDFQTGNDAWTKTCPYTASIEFNELAIGGETVSCTVGAIDSNSNTSNLVDLTAHKIAQFSDSWNFSIADEAQNFATNSDNGSALNIFDTQINVSYNISATGKDYFPVDSFTGTPDTSAPVVPGWLNAKAFVQDRLYNQIRNLDAVLGLNGSGCSPSRNLTQIHDLSANNGIINDIANSFTLYDEKITCTCSESDGTFGLNYSAILKKDEDNDFSSGNVIHTVTKESSFNKEGSKSQLTITINGEVKGLCEGGVVSESGNFSLPENGTILVSSNNNNRFSNAEAFLSKIISGDDLTPLFKEYLDVDALWDTVPNGTELCASGISPDSFNLTKNYMDGTITYSVGYSTNRLCSRTVGDASISKTTVTIDKPTPVIAEVPIPKGDFIIQDIGTYTARRISLSCEGKAARLCCFNSDSLSQFCGIDMEDFFSFITFPDPQQFVLTNKQFKYDPLVGSYNLDLAYICTSGCEI